MTESQNYLEWLKKFEVKHTTDSCFTPPAIYDAVCSWAVNEYHLQGRNILRPFVPGGDYQAVDYQPGDVVIDNPPFSLTTQIVRYYEANSVDYFIFANHLTLFYPDALGAVIVNEAIVYDNGASISTGFLTNLDPHKVRSAPDLKAAIRQIQNAQAAAPPKYTYPPQVITAARLGKIATVDFRVPRECSSSRIRALDSQVVAGKQVFGGGLLISDRCAKQLQDAIIEAAQLRGTKTGTGQDEVVWELSERELRIIDGLNRQAKKDAK